MGRFLFYRAIGYVGIFFSFTFTNVSGQNAVRLRARIVDSQTGKAIPNAIVHIRGNSSYSISDKQGYFTLETHSVDSVVINIHCMGYKTADVLWPTGNPENVTFKMIPSLTVLDEILVKDKNQPLLNQTSLTAREIERKDPRDIGDLFHDQPGFGVIKRGGYAMDPVFRSFKYERLNLIFDGGVYVSNACPNRMDPPSTHVTPGDIERIELIRGPYSMRYGPTMGAVINIITQKPAYSQQFNISGNVEGGYDFNGNGISGRAAILMTNRNYDLMVDGGLKDYGNYVNGNGDVVPSSFRHYDYAVKFGLAPKAGQRLQINWRQNFARDIDHAALPMDSEFDNSSILSADYAIDKPDQKVFSLKWKGYFSYVDHLMSNKNRPNYKIVEAESPVNAATWGGKFELGIKPFPKSVIYTGIDLRMVHKDGYRYRLVKIMNGQPLDPPKLFKDLIWQNSHNYNSGIFAESTFFLAPQWDLTAGIRLDILSSNALDPAPDFKELYGEIKNIINTGLSFATTLRYMPGEHGLFMLSLGRGKRPASLTERYINHFTIGMDAYEYVGNPFLDPEINNQADLSAEGHFGKIRLSGDLFYSFFQHYITAIVDENIPRKFQPNLEPKFAKRFINIDRACQYGFQAGVNYRLIKPLNVYGGVYYTRAQNVDFNEPLPEITPLTGMFSLSFEKKKYYIEWAGRVVARQDKVAASFDESPSPGFQVWNLTGGYTPFRFATFTFAVRNIFNANYYEHLSRPYKNLTEKNMFYEPGRQFYLGLKLNF